MYQVRDIQHLMRHIKVLLLTEPYQVTHISKYIPYGEGSQALMLNFKNDYTKLINVKVKLLWCPLIVVMVEILIHNSSF